MTTPFNFDQALLPNLRTRKALLLLDLQNDFVSPDGALPVTAPEGFVHRAIEVAKSFRDSGAGDVIWVRSQFEAQRSAGGERIVTQDAPILPTRAAAGTRGRRRTSEPPDEERPEADPEAFLSTASSAQEASSSPPQCVRPGTVGSELASHVKDAVDSGRDLVLTKTHYSAFESSQLLMRLRTRFATELYICGALTNVSIYATALDAGRHGLATTIIEDCCGYRSEMRHVNSIRKLMQLTGCESILAENVTAVISPNSSAQTKALRKESGVVTRAAGKTVSYAAGGNTSDGEDGRRLPVRTKHRDIGEDDKPGPSLGLSGASTAALVTKAQPQTQPLQPVVVDAKAAGSPSRADPNPLEVDPDLPSSEEELSASDNESPLSHRLPFSSSRATTKLSAGDLKKHLLGAVNISASRVRRTSSGVTGEPSLTKSFSQQGKSNASAETAASPSKTETKQQVTPRDRPSTSVSPSEETSRKSESSSPVGSSEGQPLSPKMKELANAEATEALCEGDTTVFHNVLPPSIEEGVFERLRDEVRWLRMSHQGGEVPRLVCVQGHVDSEGNMPVYRHPADESPPLIPFTATVVQIKDEVETILGHPLNHVLIQFYRDGTDYISEHSDKTLDIVPESFICNVSLGAERTMVFRTKKAGKDPSRKPDPGNGESPSSTQPSPEDLKRQTQRARLPHNSLCRMGLKTNMRWLHAIRQDKRADRDKLPAELAFEGGRISLTFRRIGTYLNRDNTLLWGQGATSKSRENAKPVVNGQTAEAVAMLRAFGTENHSSEFDWAKNYGQGFDILHMSNAPRFFSSSDPVVNMRIQLMLADLDIAYARGSMGPALNWKDGKTDLGNAPPVPENLPVRFVDNDRGKSIVQGDAAILLYLDAVHGRTSDKTLSSPQVARKYTRLQQALVLVDKWRAVVRSTTKDASGRDSKMPNYLKSLRRELAMWDGYASETVDNNVITAGDAICIADFALWPVLYDMETMCGDEEAFISGLRSLGLDALASYHTKFKKLDCVKRVLNGDTEAG